MLVPNTVGEIGNCLSYLYSTLVGSSLHRAGGHASDYLLLEEHK